jgi:hypothetical protein
LSVSDVGVYVIIRELMDSILNMCQVFIRRWVVRTCTGRLFRKVAYARDDVPWFVKQTDSSKTFLSPLVKALFLFLFLFLRGRSQKKKKSFSLFVCFLF